MLRPIWHPVACCCTAFETGQTLEPLTPNISFVPCSATLLDLFTQLFQHCRGRACAFLTVYKVLWVVFFPRCTVGATNVGNYCTHMQTTAETDATTPNIVGPAMLRVLMIYEINHIWTAGMKWKWRNDRRSERNLCNCVKKPEKNSGLQRGLNPWPRDYRCDSLPTELWSY